MILMLARIRRDDDSKLDHPILRWHWCYEPRNLHFRRRFDPVVVLLLVIGLLALALDAWIAWRALHLLGVLR